jgi:small GTP-binding protein
MLSQSCKVVLLGESGVGKTSIINRFINDTFDPNSLTSLGASFISKPLYIIDKKKSLKLDIWDTAGQEKYRSLAKIFYKDAKIIIFVYDITNQKSFEQIKNYWYSQTEDYGESNIIYGIAANKSDLYETEQVNEEDAKQFARSINAVFSSTSAKGNSGIDTLFQKLGLKFLDPKCKVESEDKIKEENYKKQQQQEEDEDGNSKVQLDKNKMKTKNKKDCKC